MIALAHVLLAFLFPALVQLLRDRFKALKFLNPLLTSYAAGILLGNTVLRGQVAFAAFDLVSTVAVGFSIPLMLFTLDLRSWGKDTGKMMLGMALASVSILVTVVLGALFFPKALPEYPDLAGLLVGVYTGGTPNLAALRVALAVDKDLYLAVHAADVVIGSLYILFFITAAKRVFGWVLPVRPAEGGGAGEAPHLGDLAETPGGISGGKRFPFIGSVLKNSPRLPLARNVLLAVLAIGLSFGAGMLVPESYRTMTVILGITTIAIALSFSGRIRETEGSFDLGEYLILVFCFAAGAMGDIRRIIGASPAIFLMVACAVVAAVLIHLVLCKLFGLDRDTMMISSTAAICSPPFVGMVAGALGNKRIIAPGIAAGIVGYAIGNYLGVLTSRLLSLLLG